MRSFVILALAAGLAVAVTSPVARAAANSTVPAVATFWDDAAYAITSDDGGPYIDGQSGVTSHFFTSPGQRDWVQFHSSKPGRTVRFRPAFENGAAAFTGMLDAEKPIINIDDLASTTGVNRMLSSASFDTSVGRFRFDDIAGCHVAATFDGGNQWTVSTDPVPDVSDPSGYRPGVCDLARLVKVTQTKREYTETTVGYYKLPFKVTVRFK